MTTEPFSKEAVARYDAWYQSRWGSYADEQEKRLLIELAARKPGETVLDVGCGTGRYLSWLKEIGLGAVGVDCSPAMAQAAHQRLTTAPPVGGASLPRPPLSNSVGGASSPRCNPTQVIVADGHQLPFADNSFDLVVAITTLEFAADPRQFVAEMVRVSRSRIFLGVLNRFSLYYLQQRRREGSTLSQIHFYSVSELLALIREVLDTVSIRWRTTLLGPAANTPILHTLTRCLDYISGSSRLPWGAYIGTCVDLTPRL